MEADDKQVLDDLAQGMKDLSEAVVQMREGQVDRETVANIATAVTELQERAAPVQNRRGYKPEGDEETDTDVPATYQGRDRLEQILTRSAGKVAQAIRRPEADIREFHQRSDELVLLGLLMNRPGRRAFDVRDSSYFQEEWLPLARAMDTATTAEGAEYVPRDLSASLIERINLPLRVAALFPTIPMPTPVYDIPAYPVARQKLGRHAEQTADTGQTKFTKITPATRKVTLTAVKFAGEVLVSKEAEEDSIIPMLSWIREEVADYMAGDIEDCTINGDTTATHQDTDVAALGADDPRKNFIGLRKMTVSGGRTDAGNAALTVAMLRTNRKKMGKYGIDPGNLVHLVSINNLIQLLADASVITMEKYGPAATIVTGELARVDGSPIIATEYLRTDMNAVGVNDGATTNRSQELTVNTRGFLNGTRRDITTQVLTELYSESDQDAVLISTRRAFAARFPTATELVVSSHFNTLT